MRPVHRFGFVLEQALGHITHTQNLRLALGDDPSAQIDWALIPFEASGVAARLPVLRSNWTLRAGLGARAGLARMQRRGPLDALLFHTQVPAMLALDWVRRVPSVISLDATPLQYDSLGDVYDHTPGPAWAERAKWQLHRAAFGSARRLVTWSRWAAEGLVGDYGVPAERVEVIPPGVHPRAWARWTPRTGDGPVRILFVGGDLRRKGGHDLLAAFRALRDDPALPPVELHLVTRGAADAEPGVTVHTGVQPNSPELRQLYHESDIFCLPTLADCLPMVLAEAGAAGLPMVSTPVGAIPELVRQDQTGLLVPRSDARALAEALRALVTSRELRLSLGERAAALVAADHDARRNAARLLGVMHAVADERRDAARAARGFDAGEIGARREVLLTVSGVVAPDTQERAERGERPRADYLELARALDADIIDYRTARAQLGLAGRLAERLGGPDLALALACYRRRGDYRAIFTDGEQVGIPLAALLKIPSQAPRPQHLMIGHVVSAPKKLALLDLLRLHETIDRFVVYATWQQRFIQERWNLPPDRVLLTPFMVDERFFAPEQTQAAPRQMVCAVGLERRDYTTLIEAARGLSAEVVIAAASPWSKRADGTAGRALPPNVTVRRYSQFELRQLYAESRFLVMPLEHVEFQAGVTAILEAMAMGKAVICTRTPGQTDVVVDGVTGLYVPAHDPRALRAAIDRLLSDPQLADQMGRAGRRRVLEGMGLDQYAERLAAAARAALRDHDLPAGVPARG